MSEKKRENETWEGYADRLIREAQERGEFDVIEGMGEPCPLIDSPYDEAWWVRQKVQQERLDLMPPALAIRADKAEVMALADTSQDAKRIRALLEALNERIADANQSGRFGPPNTTMPVDIDRYLRKRGLAPSPEV